MKTYMKPEVDFVSFVSEAITGNVDAEGGYKEGSQEITPPDIG